MENNPIPIPPTIPHLLTFRQLRELLQVSHGTLHRLIATGKVPPSMKVGATHRWARSTIDAWLAAGCPDRAATEAREVEEVSNE